MRRRELPDLPDADAVRGPYGRTIAIVIAAGAFVAATIGYLEAQASRAGGAATGEASDRALAATRMSAQDQERALSKLLAASVLAEEQVRRANALRLANRLPARSGGRRAALLEARRWKALAAGTAERLADGAAAAPDGEPADVLVRSSFRADRAWGLEDAARLEARGWDRLIAAYGAILTIVAIALYLLGLALTFFDGRRIALGALGCALLAVGTAWGAYEARRSPDRPDEASAEHYALARRLLAVGDYPSARHHFAMVEDRRPDFGQAAHGHATAIFLDKTSQAGAQYPSLVEPEALEEARERLERAYDNGVRTYGVVATLGFYTFLRALEDHDPLLLRESIDLTRDATAILNRDPAAFFNLGVAQVALGEREGADAAYDVALRRTLALADTVAPQEWVAGALTDLTLLEGELQDEVSRETARALKARIAGAVATGRLDPRRPRVRVAAPRLTVTPFAVRWRARFAPEAPNDAALWVQWYRHDPKAGGWGAIAALSGPAAPRRAADGSYVHHVVAEPVAGERCLAKGRYRAEFYVDGTLAGTAETVAQAPIGARKKPLAATVDRLLSVSLCRPDAWRRAVGVVPGFTAAYVAEGGDRGIYVERTAGPVRAAVARLVARLPTEAGRERVPRVVGSRGGSRVVAVAFGPTSALPLLELVAESVADYDPVTG